MNSFLSSGEKQNTTMRKFKAITNYIFKYLNIILDILFLWHFYYYITVILVVLCMLDILKV